PRLFSAASREADDEAAAARVGEVLISHLGMSVDEVAAAVTARPALAKAEPTALVNRIDYLRDSLNLHTAKLRALVAAAPPLLGYELEHTVKPKVEWLASYLGLSLPDVGVAVTRFPLVLGYSLEERLRPRVAELEARGLSRDVVARMVKTYPQLFSMPAATVAAKLAFLASDLGLTVAEQTRVLSSNPNIMGRSVEDHLRPWVSFCSGLPSEGPPGPVAGLGMSQADMRRMAVHFPQALGYSVERNVIPTMQYFADEWGVPHPDLKRLLTLYPRTLGLSVETNLKPKAAYFTDTLGLSPDQLRDLVLDFPPLLGYSLESNIKAKVDVLTAFVTRVLPALPDDHPLSVASSPPAIDLAATITAGPRLFSYSLPRVHARLARFADPSLARAGVFGKPDAIVCDGALKLGPVLTPTDAQLDKRIARAQRKASKASSTPQ
ncbi:uncharacterized protein AMSG_01160, partial [Thecamonas trahens ATCC 50062]